jgi:hypothetical protein
MIQVAAPSLGARLVNGLRRGREDLLWALFVGGVFVGSLWLVLRVATLAAQVAAAVVAVVGGIVAAVVKHGLDLENQRRHAAFLEKQKNYATLLAMIADFARNREGAQDQLSSAHLGSWAFGDLPVLSATNAFQIDPCAEKLVELLATIRQALQQEPLPAGFQSTYRADILFPPAEQTTKLPGLAIHGAKI